MTLQYLQKLCELADRHYPENSVAIQSNENKSRKLYSYLISNSSIDENELLRALYCSPSQYEQFRMLKKRLKEKLIIIFSKDFNSSSFRISKHNEKLTGLYREAFVVNFFYNIGLQDIAIPIAEKLVSKLEKQELIDLQISMIRYMLSHYGVMGHNSKKYLLYRKKKNQLIVKLNVLLELEDIYQRLALHITDPKFKLDNSQLNNLRIKLKEIDESETMDNFNQLFYYYNSLYFLEMTNPRNPELLKICNQALLYFDKKAHISILPLYQFHQKKGIYYLLIENYREAIACFQYCFKYNPKPGGVSWQYNYRYLFLAHILEENVFKALQIVSIVSSTAGFLKLSENLREPWYIKEAFIHFLIKTGKIETETINHIQLRPFRLTRFMNEVHQFSKDKTGYNITINILQYLFLLADKKYDEALDKLNSLKQYNYRYLKKPEFARASNFIKMLLKIPEGRYRASLIRKKADRYHRKLLENPLDYSERAISLEIIPYERLWDEVLGLFSH